MIAVLAVQTIPALAQQEVVIEAFESSGEISFIDAPIESDFRVEWVPSPEGPWTDDYLPRGFVDRGERVTVPVPMVYRVVATPNPNDSFETATDVGTEDFLRAGLSIHSTSDNDYYRFTAPFDGFVDIDIYFSHAQGDLDIKLYSASSTFIDESLTEDDNESISQAVMAGSNYFLKVYGFNGATNTYDLEIRFRNFELVTVGSAGNPADTNTGYGAVAYEYQIGKYEVTNEQYVEFLNAVAASDPNGLFNTTSDTGYHITRSGTDGSYTYTADAGWENNPVNFVSFFDAMRYVNWLENGRPTGAQDSTTTEAGTYTIGSGLNEIRAPGAVYFLPSEDEWYKAAYYTGSGFTLYPTGNSVPVAETDANYGGSGGTYADTWDVGSGTAENYGTFDMGGNLLEWNEDVISSSRGLRGGSWINDESLLRSSTRSGNLPTFESGIYGFRVARLP